MKKNLLLSTLFCVTIVSANAQEFDKAADYINHIQQGHKEIMQEAVVYVRNLERGDASKDLEVTRKPIQKKLESTIVKTNGMPAYKGDRTLQDSLATFFRRVHGLISRDYIRIQRSQDSANRSYESARKLVSAKTVALNNLIKDEQLFLETLKSFTNKNKEQLPLKVTAELEKLNSIREVANHHNTLMLIYAKTKNAEAPLAKAIESKRRGEIEHAAPILTKTVKEGYATLDTLKSFKQDRSLADATRNLLHFYQNEVEFKVPTLLTLLPKGEDAKAETGNAHAAQHVNVDDHDGVATYPNTLADLNAERPVVTTNWTKASQTFLKKYLSE